MNDATTPTHDAPEALVSVVREVEAHAARSGWDQPAQLFALVETADLLQREPQLAELLGVEADDGGLTPVEQEPVEGELEELLAEIQWPGEVSGCAAVVERLVLPPEADQDIPDDPCGGTYAVSGNRVQLVAATDVATWTCGGDSLGDLVLDATWTLEGDQLVLSDFVLSPQPDITWWNAGYFSKPMTRIAS